MRRYRWGVPALVAAAGYGAVVAVAAAVATAHGDVGFLWRLTLFSEIDEDLTLRNLLADVDVTAVWPNALVLLAAGGLWGWALWQGLRGPVAGRPPLMAVPLEIAGISGGVYVSAITAADALSVIWLARSAHELIDPSASLAPVAPVAPSGPPPAQASG